MAQLLYRARAEDGHLRSGRAEVRSVSVLRDELRADGFYLVETSRARARVLVRRKVTRRELILFAYHLQTVVRSGIPLVTGLRDLSEQTRNRYFRVVLDDVIDAVAAGSGLSQALERHPKVFPAEFVQMVLAGETSGRLDPSLARLVHLLEWQEELRGQVKELVTYPIMVLLALSGLIVLLLTFVIPRFGGILESLGVGLPLPTRVLLGASTFFLGHWGAIALGASLLVAATIALRRNPRSRRALDRWSLSVPVLGELRLSLLSSQVCHFLGAFLEAGVPIGEGLGLIGRLVQNLHARAAVLGIRERIYDGDTLSSAFVASGLFPGLVLRMISIGEESGNLPESLQKAQEFYDREIPRRVKSLMDVSGPALTVVIAAILCFVLLAVLLPIYTMYGALQ